MKRTLLIFCFILSLCISSSARTKIQGIAQKGGLVIQTSPSVNYNTIQAYPNCTITIYLTGTTTLANIYADDSGTVKANPFTANSDASFYFYIDNGRYDIKFSGTGIISPFTLADINVNGFAAPTPTPTPTDFDCVESKGCFDCNSPNYNAKPNDTGITNNGSRISSCLNAATTWSLANNKHPVDAEFDDGIYTIADNLYTTNGSYAQIPLPYLNDIADTGVYLTIKPKSRVVGSALKAFAQPTDLASPVVFQSTLTGQSYSNTNGWPCLFGERDTIHDTVGGIVIADSSWMTLKFENISIMLPGNPSICGINARNLFRFATENFNAYVTGITGNPSLPPQPLNPTGVALLMPKNNVADVSELGGLTEIDGYYGGIGVSEVSHSTGYINIINCRIALFLTDSFYHMVDLERVISLRNVYTIAGLSPTLGIVPIPKGVPATSRIHLNIARLDIERGTLSNWTSSAFGYDIYDSASRLSGTIGLHVVVQNCCIDSGLNVPSYFARGLRIIDDATPYDNGSIVYDRFKNNTAGLPITVSYPQVNQGGKWITLSGFSPFNFAGGTGVLGSNPGGGNANYTESNNYDTVISIYNKYSNLTNSAGFIFRLIDNSNYWYCKWQGNGIIELHKVVTSIDTLVSVTTITAPVVGDFYAQVLVLSGDHIQWVVDGNIVADIHSTDNQLGTKHGIYALGNAVYINDFRIGN